MKKYYIIYSYETGKRASKIFESLERAEKKLARLGENFFIQEFNFN